MGGTPASRPLLRREIRGGSFQQAAQHPHTVDQETAVSGIVTPTLRHTAIDAEAIPASELVLLRQGQHPIIHLVECLGLYQPFQIILGGVIRHRVIVDPHPALIRGTIPDGFFGLTVGPLFPSAQEGHSKAGFERDGMAACPRRLVMRPQIASIQSEQLGIIQNPVQLLQDRIARLRRHPVDRTFITLYNHVRPPGGEECLGGHPLLYSRWPTLFNSQSEISDKN
jgi:hypothetical protein